MSTNETIHTPKRVIIYGAAGFIGNALRKHLAQLGHEVFSYDNGVRETIVKEVGGNSLTPFDTNGIETLDVLDYDGVVKSIKNAKPDAIVHLAEQPSAPYSMISAQHAAYTQHNNVVGSLNILWAIKDYAPECHLIKLGTAGEYPDWLYNGMTIPEGPRIKVSYGGKDDWEIPTPRYFGSLYHATKFFDSYNADYACRIWGLRSTDLNQGVIYGHMPGTRLDYDSVFGTVVNRFAVQAIAGHPLTVYGEGGQTRGFINLRNALDAIALVMQNPPDGYDVIHQITETHSVGNIARRIAELTGAEVRSVPNPRFEMPKNDFKFEAQKLKKFGLKTITLEEELPRIIDTVRAHKDRINPKCIMPANTPKWHRTEQKAAVAVT